MSQDTKTLLEWSNKYLFQNYGRAPLCLIRGEGARVWDTDGKEYLDFVGGIAVDALGHSHPKIVGAIREQATALLQVSNLYQIPSQIHLAKLLVDHSFGDRAFFCNSGTEANEAAIKLVRKYAKETRATDVVDIITMRGAFHGRTLGALSATPNEKYQHGFEPLVPGFKYVPFGDVKAVERAVDNRTAAIMVEPIQGEGGVNVAPDGYLAVLRRLCDETGALLVFDEIQTGMGRTGRLWGYQHWGVEPDVMTLAKALASGIPIGAMVARDKVARVMMAGTHGTTFGGNPFATTVGVATFTTMLEDKLPERADRVGTHLMQRLRALAGDGSGDQGGPGQGLPDRHRPRSPRRPGRRCVPRSGPPRPDRRGEDPPHDAAAHRRRERRRPRGGDRRGRPQATQAMKHLLSIADLSAEDVEDLFRLAAEWKRRTKAREVGTPLAGHSQALVFEKPSLRTRVTFEVGMAQLGGASVYLAGQDIGLGRRESIADVARNLGRWVDVIVARTFAQATVDELARHAGIPVVNALSDHEHPCQALADFFTLWERGVDLRRVKLGWIGDGNNVSHSLMLLAALVGTEMSLAVPPGYEPDPRVLETARAWGGRITVTDDVPMAARDADAIYTDVWTSMGQEAERERRLEAFSRYQVNDRVMGFAKPGAVVMHCLPAHRGEEITDAVLDGPRSVVLDQSENRLHVQKAVLLRLLGKG